MLSIFSSHSFPRKSIFKITAQLYVPYHRLTEPHYLKISP